MGLATRYLIPFVEDHLLQILLSCLVVAGIHRLLRRMRTRDPRADMDPPSASAREAESKAEKGSRNVIGEWYFFSFFLLSKVWGCSSMIFFCLFDYRCWFGLERWLVVSSDEEGNDTAGVMIMMMMMVIT